MCMGVLDGWGYRVGIMLYWLQNCQELFVWLNIFSARLDRLIKYCYGFGY